MRFTAEAELPERQMAAFGLAVRAVCQENGWEFVGLSRVQAEPPCPTCGAPMVYSRELQTYVCSHPE